MAVRYEVTHRTEYRYEADVSDSYGQLHLLPRNLPGQRCHTAEVVVDPIPDDYRERLDYFGNRVSYLAIHCPHRALTVTATSIVAVEDRRDGLSLFGDRPWEQARDAVRDGQGLDPLDAVQCVLNSPLVQSSGAFADYAATTSRCWCRRRNARKAPAEGTWPRRPTGRRNTRGRCAPRFPAAGSFLELLRRHQ